MDGPPVWLQTCLVETIDKQTIEATPMLLFVLFNISS